MSAALHQRSRCATLAPTVSRSLLEHALGNAPASGFGARLRPRRHARPERHPRPHGPERPRRVSVR